MSDFLEDFVYYGKDNESPESFKLFGGIAAISSLIGRKCWVEMGFIDIYPNLYIVFAAPAGMRKSTGMDMAYECLQDIGGIPMSAEATTKEKLVEDLTEQQAKFDLDPQFKKRDNDMHACMTCMVTELSQFLGPNSGHMIDFLTTIFDRRKYESKTRHKGNFEIFGPFLNVLACTTPDWITFYMKADVISGGFSRRTLFVYESERTKRVPFPSITQDAQEAWNRCVTYGKHLKKNIKAGPMIWSPEAREFYSDWYMKLPQQDEEWLARYYESKHVQLLKLAMIYSLAESLDKILELKHIKKALKVLDDIEVKMGRVFDGLGRNELSAIASKMFATICRQPKAEVQAADWKNPKAYRHAITEKKLRSMMFSDGNTMEIGETIQHLIDSEKVKRFTDVSRNRHQIWLVTNG